ncbi:MAG: tripartite tricarboxylate transporter substrate binding protein [Hyphomicrobiales bacterium]|nr:tripartite tricarboxylate transporter substrate binding protein [Hyphomicrobiales bacterium]
MLLPSHAAAYPERPIRVVIPLAPGGAVDLVARLLQPHLEKSLGKPLIVEHRPGASGILGAATVANADPDGHTLLLVPTTYTINAAVQPKLPFDPLRSLEPIVVVGRNSLMFLVNPKVPARTLREFAELAKAQPGKLNYATPGASSQAHFLLELWSAQAGIRMQHIPYRGGAPAVLATVSGETQITLISPPASMPQIESGALRALATGGTTREQQLPDIPTAAEAGYPDFTALQWIGVLATGGTPKPVIERLNRELQQILQLPEVKMRLFEQGMTVAGGTPDEFRALLENEIKQWIEVARRANIQHK